VNYRFEEKMNVPRVIKHFATMIIKVVCDYKHVENYRMVPKMNVETLMKKDEESWTNLFKTRNVKYSFFWDDVIDHGIGGNISQLKWRLAESQLLE
jgi:hypothetical protein